MHIPQLCLDVLTQHIVAMAANHPLLAEDVLRVARRSQPFHTLSRPQLDNVLAMLAGRFRDVRFEGLRPRLEYDEDTGEIRARPGALRLAVINGGTIPDRGYLAVELLPGAEGQKAKKLGELDEEFAAELYVGGRPAFSLGTSVWGVEAVERDRVLVRPAPGEPYQIPFWRGDRLGRGPAQAPRLVREVASRLQQPEEQLVTWLRAECCLDEDGARALMDYVRRQEEAAGHVPHDRAIVLETFQDEIGDYRMVIHSLFGMAINGAWAFALKPRLREALGGIDPLVMHNDDGIIMRLPPMELAIEPFARTLLEQVRADTVEELLIGELADAPMLALRFREAAQRALLLPKAQPNHRTPLWLRRQRAADLLSIVRRKEGFPVLQEAVRECLHDTWDLNGLRTVLRGIEAGEIATPFVQNRNPSPFAGSLVWDFGLAFGEEGDAPRGECRAAYLALNRDLLRETLEAENLRELLDPEVLATAPGWADGGTPIAASASAQPIREAIYEYMRDRRPQTADEVASALGLPLAKVQPQLNALVEASQLSCGEYLPGGTELEYCAPLLLARLHRESLRRAREQVAPVDAARFAAFVPAWQGLGLAAAGRKAVAALLQLPLTRELWTSVLTTRFGPDGAAAVDNLTSRGLLEWRALAGGK
ncbi:MAG TPA: hypothetical protein VFS62_10600, partial [Chloroflexota bacterium]|nr:hypothetical protein [Chloroflexota bacterium]